jgi:hypothetical protein
VAGAVYGEPDIYTIIDIEDFDRKK